MRANQLRAPLRSNEIIRLNRARGGGIFFRRIRHGPPNGSSYAGNMRRSAVEPGRQDDMVTEMNRVSADGWQGRLALVVETMREVSRQSDPQEMVRVYGRHARRLLPRDDM